MYFAVIQLLYLGMTEMNSPLFLFHAAKEFFENGTVYASKYFKRAVDGKTDLSSKTIHPKLCVPATNITFSLELIFKAFLMQSQTNKFGHDLVSLYALLNCDIKARILDHYKGHDTYKNFIGI